MLRPERGNSAIKTEASPAKLKKLYEADLAILTITKKLAT
jgi:hypothetical protein